MRPTLCTLTLEISICKRKGEERGYETRTRGTTTEKRKKEQKNEENFKRKTSFATCHATTLDVKRNCR